MTRFPDIEGYEILEVIGRGGMGTVYRARNLRHNRLVAIKVIHGHLADDATFKSRFESEIKVALQLDHPNLVPVLDAGESGDSLYLSFALIRGSDLRAYLRANGPMSPDDAVDVIRQVTSALDYVHENEIVHRDVKPSNIMRDGRTGHIYLSDFGIAKAKDASDALTGSSGPIGAIGYMAPEQFDNVALDERTDVYATGCLLFELLAGDTPYEEESAGSLLKAKLDDEPRSLAEVGVDVGPELEEVVARAIHRDRELRFQNVNELSKAAVEALDGTSPEERTRRLPLDRTERQEETRRISDPTESLEDSKKPAWLKTLLIGGVAAIVLATAGIGVARFGSDESGKSPDPGSTGQATKTDASGGGGNSPDSGNTTVSQARDKWTPVSTTLVDAEVPKGWETLKIDEVNSNRRTSQWENPTNPDVTVLIDAQTPAPNIPVLESAAKVRADTSRSAGYEEISFAQETIGDREVARWEFYIPDEGQKVDYFFQECNVGMAVLGTAPPGLFDEYTADFRHVVETASANCQSLDADSPITTEGIGPVLVGMTESEAEAAGNIELSTDGYVSGSCGYFHTDSLNGVNFMFHKGTLARVDVMNPAISTLSGVSVGDSEADVYAAYGESIKETPEFYEPEHSSDLTYIPDDPNDHSRVSFDVTRGEVVHIRAGRLPEVNYVEGCA